MIAYKRPPSIQYHAIKNGYPNENALSPLSRYTRTVVARTDRSEQLTEGTMRGEEARECLRTRSTRPSRASADGAELRVTHRGRVLREWDALHLVSRYPAEPVRAPVGSRRKRRCRRHVGGDEGEQLLDGKRLLHDPGPRRESHSIANGQKDDHGRARERRALVQNGSQGIPVGILVSGAQRQDELVGRRSGAGTPREHGGAARHAFHPVSVEDEGIVDDAAQVEVRFHDESETGGHFPGSVLSADAHRGSLAHR